MKMQTDTNQGPPSLSEKDIRKAFEVAVCITLAFISGLAGGYTIHGIADHIDSLSQEPEYYGMYLHTYCDGSRVNGTSSLTLEFLLGEYPIRLHAADQSSIWGSLGHSGGDYQRIPRNTQVNITGFVLVNATLLNETWGVYSWSHRIDLVGSIYLNGSTYIIAADSPFGIVGYEIETAAMGSKWWNGGGRNP